jgi:hypothetical protein
MILRKRANHTTRRSARIEGAVMKPYCLELPVWCLLVAVALVFTAIWVVDALTTNVSGQIMARFRSDVPSFGVRRAYLYDGSLAQYVKWDNKPYIIEPRSASGLITFWWPVIVSVGIGILAQIFVLLPTLGVPLRKRIQIPRVRLTLFRVMVLVGTVSAWLWLGRLDIDKRIIGTLIIGFMLHAGFRRSFLAKEAIREQEDAKALARAGIAGYSLILILAILWVISILVWELYQEHRF